MKGKMRALWTVLTMFVSWLIGELYWAWSCARFGAQKGAIPIDSLFEITEATPGFTLGSDVAAGGGDGVTEHLYGYFTVPDGVRLIFLPTSEFQFYGKDNEAAPAEFTDYVPLVIYHRDNSGQGTLRRGGGLYVNCKFAANTNERKKLNDKWPALPKEEVQFKVICESGKSIDVSACHVSLTCRRIAPMLTP